MRKKHFQSIVFNIRVQTIHILLKNKTTYVNQLKVGGY